MNLESGEARSRFAAAAVLRMATTTPEGAPHLVPATFAVRAGPDGDEVVIAVDAKPKRHQRLRRLQNLRANPAVSLLVDHYDEEDWSRLWWVRADGVGDVLDTEERALDLLAAKYPQYRVQRPTGAVIVVHVARWSGWASSDATG